MDKVAAHQIGVTKALLDKGFDPESVKIAFVQQGMHEKRAEFLVKQAGRASFLMKAMRPAASWLRTALGAGTKSPAKGSLLKGLTEGGAASRGLAGGLHGGATALRSGLIGLANRPLQTLGRGALEAGKGALLFGGKGIGGTVGKGIGGYHMGRMILGD